MERSKVRDHRITILIRNREPKDAVIELVLEAILSVVRGMHCRALSEVIEYSFELEFVEGDFTCV